MRIFKLFFLLFCVTSFSQIKGHYYWTDPSGLTGINFEFDTNHFTQLSGTDIGIKHKSKGYYKIINDTLILIYDNPIDKNVEIKKQGESIDSLGYKINSTQLNFEVKFDNNNKAVGTTIVLRDAKNNVLKGFTTDNDGKYSLLLSDISNVDNIIIANLNDQVELKLDNFLYKISDLKIIISQQKWKYTTYNGLRKYLIKKIENNKIHLNDLYNNQNIILLKNKKKR